MDIKKPEDRSKNMSAIKSKNTSPELAVRKIIHAAGFRYRLFVKNIPGKPDLYFPKYHTAIFVNGCFWHRHSGCQYATFPSSNEIFWLDKFQKNIDRDIIVHKMLISQKIKVLVIWECSVKRIKSDESKIEFIKQIKRVFSSSDVAIFEI